MRRLENRSEKWSKADLERSFSNLEETTVWLSCHPLVIDSLTCHSVTASIVMPDADLSLAVPAVFFGSVGTAGQRCTSTRRLYLHRSIAPEFISSLQSLYANLKPGDPLDEKTLLGPLHNRAAVNIYDGAIKRLKDSGAEILCGGSSYSSSELSANGVTVNGNTGGNFVKPTISIPTRVDVKNDIWSKEVFAPILNVGVFDELEEAIEWNNGVPQGLSSSIWTRDLRNVGKWIGPSGSDTGIVNVRGLVVLSVDCGLSCLAAVLMCGWLI